MKYRLLDMICCPHCRGALQITVWHSEQTGCPLPVPAKPCCAGHCHLRERPPATVDPADCVACYQSEIIEGKLICTGCGNCYPIIEGIPRLLPLSLLAESLATYQAAFCSRHPDAFVLPTSGPIGTDPRKLATLHTFSYQWTTFVRNFGYFRALFLSFVHPFLEERDFAGKLVLEVGCGSGRPASVAASFGAEVVAFDLSEAVRTAQSLTAYYPRLHIVQGDVYAPPFIPRFDFVYSVGVIQHLPDPALALQRITPVVPPNRPLVIWVYGNREAWYAPIEWLRRITTRLPYRMLHGLALMLALLSELLLLIPYRLLVRIPCTRNLAESIPGRIYARLPFRENVLGWFDRLSAPITHYFSQAQVEKMLTEAGFEQVEVVARAGASASWVAQGIRRDKTTTA